MRLVGLELIHSLGLFRTHLICFRHFHSLGEVVLAQTSVRKGTGDQLAGALALTISRETVATSSAKQPA